MKRGLFIPAGVLIWLWAFVVGSATATGITLCACGYKVGTPLTFLPLAVSFVAVMLWELSRL